MNVKLGFIIFFSTLSCSVFGQLDVIYLGKKGNIILDKNISSSNLNSIFTYYYPVYYKTSETNKYQKTGIFGRHIAPQLVMNLPEVEEEFRRYKTDKKLSYALLGGAIGSIASWTYISAKYIDRTGDQRIGAFFKPQHLPLLAGYFACFYGSIHINLSGDRHLKNAVNYHNKYIKNKKE